MKLLGLIDFERRTGLLLPSPDDCEEEGEDRVSAAAEEGLIVLNLSLLGFPGEVGGDPTTGGMDDRSLFHLL